MIAEPHVSKANTPNVAIRRHMIVGDETYETQEDKISGKISRRECITNHVRAIDLTSHNVCFTTLTVVNKDESAYVTCECYFGHILLLRGSLSLTPMSYRICTYVDTVILLIISCTYVRTYTNYVHVGLSPDWHVVVIHNDICYIRRSVS